MSAFRPITLRQGLIWVVFAALLPIAIVSVWQGFSTYNNTRNLTISRLNAKAKAVAERQRDPFVIAQHLLITLAADPEVRNFGNDCTQAFSSAFGSYKPIVNFVRSDATGLVRCSVLPYEPGTTLAEDAWWKKGIDAGKLTITPTVFGRISQRQVIIIMVPINDAGGGQNGALSTAIEIDFLKEALRNAPESKSGMVAIVSAQGEVVADAGRALPFKPDIAAALKDGSLTQSSGGQPWIYAVAPLYSRNLFAVYAEPHEGMMDSALNQFRIATLLPLLSILFASLAIWFGTHRLVVRWLRDLAREADWMAVHGSLENRRNFDGAPKEIAELSASLHSMAEVVDRRTADLTAALKAKTELTREVHHRVKNNLQIITSLLTLQAGRLAEGGAKDVLGQTRSRIAALALIHRLLYEQDNGNEQGRVAIAQLLRELCVQLRSGNRQAGAVDLQCKSDDDSIPIDHAVPIALFVVEAVTNAYSHAFGTRSSGAIKLLYASEGNQGTITISDDGDGYSVHERAGQMGTELMNAFATQVGGMLTVESVIGKGTQVWLQFPLAAGDGTES